MASAAADLYVGLKARAPKAVRQLAIIKRDARRGVPAAQQALAKVQGAQQADRLRVAAKRGDQGALRQMSAISRGMNDNDVQAIEAAKMVERLELNEGFKPSRFADTLTHRFDADVQQPETVANEVVGAIMDRRIMSPNDRMLHSKLLGMARR
jgi:hypothetical protein